MVNPILRIRSIAPSDGDKSSVTILVAYHAARAFIESGMHEYHLLHDVHLRDQKPETRPDALEYLRHAVPAANNLSFALEVHLKILQAQRSGHYPQGHRIRDLVNKLSQSTKDALQRQLIQSCASDRFKYITEFSIQLLEKARRTTYAFRMKCEDDPRPDFTAAGSFEAEVELCDRLYTRWRYLYERGVSASPIDARFFGLIHMNRAIAAEIESFEEGVVITGESD